MRIVIVLEAAKRGENFDENDECDLCGHDIGYDKAWYMNKEPFSLICDKCVQRLKIRKGSIVP